MMLIMISIALVPNRRLMTLKILYLKSQGGLVGLGVLDRLCRRLVTRATGMLLGMDKGMEVWGIVLIDLF